MLQERRPNRGRPSAIDEEKRARVVNKAWAIAEGICDGKKKYAQQQVTLVQTIVSKTSPSQLMLQGDKKRPIAVVDFSKAVAAYKATEEDDEDADGSGQAVHGEGAS